MDKASDLIPEHFRFVKGLVDSQDLSLNISREMLQHDRQLKVIADRIEKKIQSELTNMLKKDRETYEKFFKNRTAISIYLLSGIAGAVLSSLMSVGPSVGASGAIFGMMGANGYYILKNKELFGEINRRVGKVLIIVSIIWIINGLGEPMIDNYAHIGGFLGGIFTAALFKGRNMVEYSQIRN